jgi:hypothetical protein
MTTATANTALTSSLGLNQVRIITGDWKMPGLNCGDIVAMNDIQYKVSSRNATRTEATLTKLEDGDRVNKEFLVYDLKNSAK